MTRVYAENKRFVAWVAARRLTAQDEIEDVVQDVFAIAAAQIDSLQDPARARGWLKTVTSRRVTRRLRSQSLLMRLDARSRGGPEGPHVSPGASPEDVVLVREVLLVLERMSSDLRTAWCHRYLHEESLEVVAKRCGCSLSTAKRRISAAATMMREKLR